MINGKVDITKAINILLVGTSATCSVLSTRPGKLGPKSREMMGHRGGLRMGICSHLKAKQTSTHSPIHSCRSLNALYPSWEETSYTNWMLLSTVGDKLQSGVPGDKGHKIMTLMAEDEPPQTEQVHRPEVKLKVGDQGQMG